MAMPVSKRNGAGTRLRVLNDSGKSSSHSLTRHDPSADVRTDVRISGIMIPHWPGDHEIFVVSGTSTNQKIKRTKCDDFISSFSSNSKAGMDEVE